MYSAINRYYNLFRGALNCNAFCHSKVPAFLNVVDTCAGFEFQQFSFHFCHSKVPAFLNVVDIAGLVKGAHEGQGLGNAFLSNISACDAIFHMSRKYLCLTQFRPQLKTHLLTHFIPYSIRSGAFRAYYSIYASVRFYMRIHESHHQLPGFAILKKKNEKKNYPWGSARHPSNFLHHGDAILAVISRSMECLPNVDSWSNIEWFTNGGRRCFGQRR